MSKQPLTNEQIKVIGEIWELLELMGEPTSHADLEKIIAPDGVVLTEFKLRAIHLAMKEARLHGKSRKVGAAQSI